MKKSFKTFVGASLACALVLSGCSEIADIEENDSTFVESSRAASSISLVKSQGWLNSAYVVWNGSGSNWTVTCDGVAVNSLPHEKSALSGGATFRGSKQEATQSKFQTVLLLSQQM